MSKLKFGMTRFILIFGVCSIFIIQNSCKEDIITTPFYEGIIDGNNISIWKYIEENPEYSYFQELLIEGNLNITLTAYNPKGNNYTLFLPTNDAVQSFLDVHNYSDIDQILADKAYVDALVRYHVVNSQIIRNNFPYGPLPDTTLTGNQLTISYTSSGDTVLPVINNYAKVTRYDIELTNGYVHVINNVLVPPVSSSYDWLAGQMDEFSIFKEALDITGLRDSFKLSGPGNSIFYPENSLLVEPDALFEKNNIYSINDLVSRYSPDDENYTSESNKLYEFVSYHILDFAYFIDDFEGKATNYGTSTQYPVMINGLGLDLKINPGSGIYDVMVEDGDTTIINYVRVDYDNSNNITANGAIHILSDLLEPYNPPAQDLIFQFYEESLISAASQIPTTYIFDNEPPKEFSGILTWSGIDEIIYQKSPSAINNVYSDDYIEVNGNFTLTYKLPKIQAGKYLLQLNANDDDPDNATIQVFLDGEQIGRNLDLTQNAGSKQSFFPHDVDYVYFDDYSPHEITIKSVVSGKLQWDCTIFKPL